MTNRQPAQTTPRRIPRSLVVGLLVRYTDLGDPMSRQIVSTLKAAKPPATYSQAVKAADLVFVSGTTP